MLVVVFRFAIDLRPLSGYNKSTRGDDVLCQLVIVLLHKAKIFEPSLCRVAVLLFYPYRYSASEDM